MLFVPGDRPERMENAAQCGADAVILDLEDSVLVSRKPWAREQVREYLTRAAYSVPAWVRINPLKGGEARNIEAEFDLEALAGCRLAGIVLPKAEGAGSILELEGRLRAAHIPCPILPIATETPKAVFCLAEYATVADRLGGLTWGAEDLPAAVGAQGARTAQGAYTAPYELVRSMTLFAGHAAGVATLDTVYPFLDDDAGLERYAQRAAHDGFTGMLAIHPRQVRVINSAFTPSPAATARARRVVEAFRESGDAGVVSLDGVMLDAPHLKAAQRILRAAGDA